MSKTAFSYIRFSTAKQELGDSLRRQTKLAEDYAKAHDLVLDTHSYRDLGISAFKGRNAVEGALGTFLQALDMGIIRPGAYLLIESLDRLSRNDVDEALQLFLDIVRKGIILVTLSDGMVYSKASLKENWTKFIIALAVMSRANEEMSTKSKRIKESWEGKRNAGVVMTSMAPAWLETHIERTVDEKGKPQVTRSFSLIKAKADIVRKVFKFAATGLGSPSIARKLNEEGIPTVAGKAKEWSSSLVSMLLKNRTVIGTLSPKGADPIEGYYPEIVKKEVFYLAQQMRTSRQATGAGHKRENVSNLLSGISFCECGRRMRMVSATGDSRYVRCLSAYAGTGCDAPQMPYHAVEEAMLGMLVMLDVSVTGVKEAADPRLGLKIELENARARLERLLDLAETGSAGIAGRITKVEAEITVIEQQMHTFIPVKPLEETWIETLKLLERYTTDKDAGRDVNPLRLQLQGAMRRLVTKAVFLKADHENKHGRFREIALYGPIQGPLAQQIQRDKDMLKTNRRRVHNATIAEQRRVLKDGACVIEYAMPLKGFQPGNKGGKRPSTR